MPRPASPVIADDASAAPVVVLAMSARWMAEPLAREGHCVLACDLFGDADTRAVSQAWARAGDPDLLALDAAQCRRSLQGLVAGSAHAPLGWLAGPGCESLLAELQAFMDALGVPLIGNDAATVDAVRDPQRFFAALDANGLAHPPVSWDAVAPITPLCDEPAQAWLSKDAWGSGGWHIALCAGSTDASLQPMRAAAELAGAPEVDAAVPLRPPVFARRYWQRFETGQPVSLLFLADGHEIVPLAWQRQIVAPHGTSPFAWQGVQGPLQLALALQAEGLRAAQRLTQVFGLRGLNSLDGLLVARGTPVGRELLWLELNPRCSASMALYPDWPLMCWHQQACSGEPDALGNARAELGRQTIAATQRNPWRGTRIVWADRDAPVSDAALASARRLPGCHDVAAGAFRAARGMPLVTVSATAVTEMELELQLAGRACAARQLLMAGPDSAAAQSAAPSAPTSLELFT